MAQPADAGPPRRAEPPPPGPRAGAPRGARLVPLRSPGTEPSPGLGEDPIELPQDGGTVGRKDSCTVCINIPTLSGQQCRIRPVPEGHWVLEDLSANGTFVNNRQVGRGKSVPLASGDTIRLTKKHGVQFRFELVVRSAQLVPEPRVQLPPPPQPTVALPPPTATANLKRPVPHVCVLASANRALGGAPKDDYSAVGCDVAAASASGGGRAEGAGLVDRGEGENAVPHSASAVLREALVGARQYLAHEVERASAMSAELERAQVALAAGHPSEADGGAAAAEADDPSADTPSHSSGGPPWRRTLRAEEEAMQEAEHSRLVTQRRWVERQVRDAEAARACQARELAKARATVGEEREARERLAEDLGERERRAAELRGEREAISEFLADTRQNAAEAEAELERLQAVAHRLEADLEAARAAVEEARAAEGAAIRRLGRKEGEQAEVRRLARELARDIKVQAESLLAAVSVEVPASSSTAPPPALLRRQQPPAASEPRLRPVAARCGGGGGRAGVPTAAAAAAAAAGDAGDFVEEGVEEKENRDPATIAASLDINALRLGASFTTTLEVVSPAQPPPAKRPRRRWRSGELRDAAAADATVIVASIGEDPGPESLSLTPTAPDPAAPSTPQPWPAAEAPPAPVPWGLAPGGSLAAAGAAAALAAKGCCAAGPVLAAVEDLCTQDI